MNLNTFYKIFGTPTNTIKYNSVTIPSKTETQDFNFTQDTVTPVQQPQTPYYYKPSGLLQKQQEIKVPLAPETTETTNKPQYTYDDSLRTHLSNYDIDDSMKEYLLRMETKEAKQSGKNSKWKSQHKNGAAGMWQFMPRTREAYSNFSLEQWLNSPDEQTKAMIAFTKDNIATFTKDEIEKAKQMGYSIYALAAGAHLGGATGVKRFLKTGYNPKDQNGTRIVDYMNAFKDIV